MTVSHHSKMGGLKLPHRRQFNRFIETLLRFWYVCLIGPILSNEVECDEAYVVAGHKGQPEVVKSKERQGRRRRRKSKAGRGTLEKEKPPVFGMMERGGLVVLHLLANVKQKTIEPLIKDTIESGTLVTQMNTAFTLVSSDGVMAIKASIMAGVNMPEMKMATVFVKCM
jgi:hypothetical protein